eukprot:COSAG01_NODE_1564_length_9896_cov_4.868837_1_plen_90_part_00
MAATDRSTGCCVAIKHIDRLFYQKLDAVRTIRELRLLRVLRHPSLVHALTVLVPPLPICLSPPSCFLSAASNLARQICSLRRGQPEVSG